MERMETYARLLLRTGLDLQKGQTLLLNADTEAAPLVAVLAAQAYRMGAADVQCNWSNEACDRARLLYQILYGILQRVNKRLLERFVHIFAYYVHILIIAVG